jgi:Ca2+-binding EF-hand superfamily protein
MSDLQERKFKRLFTLFDFNGDGYVQAGDFEDLLIRIANVMKVSPDSAEYRRLRFASRAVWDFVFKDAEVSGDYRVDLREWLSHCEQLVKVRYFEHTVPAAAGLFFDLFDQDKDGKISRDELVAFYQAFNMDGELAKRNFARYDRDGDGFLDKEHVVHLVQQFHTSSDLDAEGNAFFGPY